MSELKIFLISWRDELRTELSTNASGHLSRKFRLLAKQIPDSFPDPHHVLLYAKPLTSWSDCTTPGPDLSALQPLQPDLSKLTSICKRRFDWEPSPGILKKFRNVLWDGLCMRMLCNVTMTVSYYYWVLHR